MKSGTGVASDSASQQTLETSLKLWQDVIITGGKVKNNAVSYDVELNLLDKSTNSLTQLNSYFDLLSKQNKSTVSF